MGMNPTGINERMQKADSMKAIHQRCCLRFIQFTEITTSTYPRILGALEYCGLLYSKSNGNARSKTARHEVKWQGIWRARTLPS